MLPLQHLSLSLLLQLSLLLELELQIYLSTLAWLVSVHLSWCRWVLLQGLDLLGVLLISNISVTLCLALELVGDRSLILWGLC